MPSERNEPPSTPEQCHDCGRSVPAEANFCPGCGAERRSAASSPSPPLAYCMECGDPFGRGDEFCANCGTPRQTGDVPPADRGSDRDVDPAARRAFRHRVQDHLADGWELHEDHGDRVVLVDREIGSIPIHVLLLLTTGGVGNLLYGWYHYAELAETRRLAVDDESLPASEPSASGSDEDPLVALSGYLLSALLLLIGLGIVAVAVDQGALVGGLFGLAFAVIGLTLAPPVDRRLDRRHGIAEFGRIRTVDHRITRATERPEEPCVVCGHPVERGVVRRRRDETVVAGVPVRTHSMRYNHYCADCAREELFGGESGGNAARTNGDVDADMAADPDADGSSEREESTDPTLD